VDRIKAAAFVIVATSNNNMVMIVFLLYYYLFGLAAKHKSSRDKGFGKTKLRIKR
jgi:hypothetical protein